MMSSLDVDSKFTILYNASQDNSQGLTMKKHVTESTRGKESQAVCSHCGGTGRDLSRSLWGEFICPVCDGTGKPVAKRVAHATSRN